MLALRGIKLDDSSRNPIARRPTASLLRNRSRLCHCAHLFGRRRRARAASVNAASAAGRRRTLWLNNKHARSLQWHYYDNTEFLIRLRQSALGGRQMAAIDETRSGAAGSRRFISGGGGSSRGECEPNCFVCTCATLFVLRVRNSAKRVCFFQRTRQGQPAGHLFARVGFCFGAGGSDEHIDSRGRLLTDVCVLRVDRRFCLRANSDDL